MPQHALITTLFGDAAFDGETLTITARDVTRFVRITRYTFALRVDAADLYAEIGFDELRRAGVDPDDDDAVVEYLATNDRFSRAGE